MRWRTLVTLAVLVVAFGLGFDAVANVVGDRSPWLALLLMLYFMGLAKFAQPLFTLRLPRPIRVPGPDAVNGRLARWLRVPLFGAVLRNTPLRYLNPSVYGAGSRRNLADLARQLESAEAIHFWGAVLFTPCVVFVAASGYWIEAAVFVAVQVFFHLYPIMHLRAARFRVARLAAR